MLMGAASADVPAIMVTGGPMLKGVWCNQELGSGTDARKIWAQRRAGEITDEVMAEVEGCLSRSSRALHGDGHRLHDGGDGRGAGPGPARQRGHPRPRLAAPRAGRDVGPPRGRDGDGPRAEALRDPDRGRVRQRDPRRHGARRLHQRHRAPGRPRGARGGAAAAPALRRALPQHAAARQRAPLRQVPDGGLLLRGRGAGGAARDAADAARRRPSPSPARPWARTWRGRRATTPT